MFDSRIPKDPAGFAPASSGCRILHIGDVLEEIRVGLHRGSASKLIRRTHNYLAQTIVASQACLSGTRLKRSFFASGVFGRAGFAFRCVLEPTPRCEVVGR